MPVKYRPDIDGLRAIAVLVVLFFHVSIPGFTGGFVGVDIFFVISGFLITSILLEDLESDRFSIITFYERRIRRIFPALFAMLAFTLLAAGYLFEPGAFRNFGKSLIATTLFCSDFFFWLQSGYFDASSLQKPLLHTWSLAVEEQFYILFPLVLLLISRTPGGKFLQGVSVLLVLSFAANLMGMMVSPSATFYLVHSRAWELLAGSILAMRVIPAPSGLWLGNLLATLGLGLIGFCVVGYSEATRFPGYNAIAPVLGACLILHGSVDRPALVNRVLSARPLVFVGLISYSLYLWHWPLVAFARYMTFRPFTVPEKAALVAASLGVSVLSWRFIEQPFRGRPRLLPDRRRLFVMAGVVMVVASGIGEILYVTRGMPGRLEWFSPGILSRITKERKDTPFLEQQDWDDTVIHLREGVAPPIIGTHRTSPCFAILGDSHASALVPAFALKAHESGVSGYVLALAGTPFLKDVSVLTLGAKDGGWDESAHNDAVLEFLRQHPEVTTVFITARWAFYIQGPWLEKTEEETQRRLLDSTGEQGVHPGNAAILANGLRKSIEALSGLGRTVILMTDVPEIGFDAPRAFYIHHRWPGLLDLRTVRPTYAEYASRQREANHILEDLSRSHRVALLHPETRMFDADGLGRISTDGDLLYEDDDHLSLTGALQVAPILDDTFRSMARHDQDGGATVGPRD